MSRLSDYISYGEAHGWDMGRWKEALEVTKTCAADARTKVKPVDRMSTFIECRRGRRLGIK